MIRCSPAGFASSFAALVARSSSRMNAFCPAASSLAVRLGAIHVRDPVASGLSAGRALSCIARAYRKVFRAFAASTHSALLLQPLGCARLPPHQPALLSMAAIPLADGCLDAACSDFLLSRPLGMLVISAAAIDAFRSAEVTRSAVSPSSGNTGNRQQGG